MIDWEEAAERLNKRQQGGLPILVGFAVFVVGGPSMIGAFAAILAGRPWTIACGVTTLATALLLFAYAEWGTHWRTLTPRYRSFLTSASLWSAVVQIGCGTACAIWRLDASVLAFMLLPAPGLVLLVVRLAPRVYG
ncbi:MAG: hypothetical protein IIB87_08420 [Chloroflexi bacterium]|nr:hypothetical protein [Chloroflexota bacterium]